MKVYFSSLLPIDYTKQPPTGEDESSAPKCIYFCGNSLGVQPRSIQQYIERYLRTWATKGVTGHFVPHEDQLLPPFVDVDTAGAKLMAPVVGALQSEVAVMGTLTGNLHFLMASFYRPTKEKYRIVLEGKAFPSDHVCVAVIYILSQHTDLSTYSMRSNLKSATTILPRMMPWF